jgi:hypothetical protein
MSIVTQRSKEARNCELDNQMKPGNYNPLINCSQEAKKPCLVAGVYVVKQETAWLRLQQPVGQLDSCA